MELVESGCLERCLRAGFHGVGGVLMFGEVFESWVYGVRGVLFHGDGGVWMFGEVFESWFHGVGG